MTAFISFIPFYMVNCKIARNAFSCRGAISAHTNNPHPRYSDARGRPKTRPCMACANLLCPCGPHSGARHRRPDSPKGACQTPCQTPHGRRQIRSFRCILQACRLFGMGWSQPWGAARLPFRCYLDMRPLTPHTLTVRVAGAQTCLGCAAPPAPGYQPYVPKYRHSGHRLAGCRRRSRLKKRRRGLTLWPRRRRAETLGPSAPNCSKFGHPACPSCPSGIGRRPLLRENLW